MTFPGVAIGAVALEARIKRVNNWLAQVIRDELKLDVWSRGFGLGRALIASSFFLTLLLNDVHDIFRPVLGIDQVPMCGGLGSAAGIFCILRDHLELARWIAIAILGLVIIGWRPRYTGVLHWWVNFSFISSAPLIDGGEQAATVVTFFLIPLALTDPRKWHWSHVESLPETEYSDARRITALTSYQLARVQIAAIYLHAAVGKCAVREWQNGTALYYWFTDPVFGAPPYLQPIIRPLILNGFTLAFMNWGAIVLEFLLFAALFMSKPWRRFMLVIGVLFHVAIGLIHGLTSFSLIMIGALIVYLLPDDEANPEASAKEMPRPDRLPHAVAA